MDPHRASLKKQIEEGQFSESFRLPDEREFRGIFDKTHLVENRDEGHVSQKKLMSRILVWEIPDSLTERETSIVRLKTGNVYTYLFGDIDDQGVPVLWLF